MKLDCGEGSRWTRGEKWTAAGTRLAGLRATGPRANHVGAYPELVFGGFTRIIIIH